MISRRHIRIKGMQALYANINSQEAYNTVDALKHYYDYINQTKVLLINTINIAKEICEFAIVDANTKGSKFLPTQADLNLSTKIAHSSVVINLASNESFNSFIKNNSITSSSHADYIRGKYMELVKKESYKTYINNTESTTADDDNIFLEIVEDILIIEEPFQTSPEVEPVYPEHYLEDVSAHFLADIELIKAWILKHKNKIGIFNYSNLLDSTKRLFGEELIDTFIEKNEITEEIIKPKLINWDADRIAMVDKMIIQLGITEILYFTSIPTKVSINEYIDIAKMYSTPQSGQFVNGVLDKIHKELLAQNKIHKTDFKHKKKSDA